MGSMAKLPAGFYGVVDVEVSAGFIERAVWLAEICKAENFRFSPRLHVDLYGDRRGV